MLEDIQEGDKILFNDRSQPLTVEKIEDERVLVEGPSGGEYEIYEAEDTEDLLFCKKGNRRYSSYCRDLRKVGEWNKEGDEWEHSKTGNYIRLGKNDIGYWVIESSLPLNEIDSPKYGYSDREEAEKDIKKVVRKNPEG